jgi:chitin elicitor receptor kinase 1
MPNPMEALQEMIDPRLGGDYPIDSAVKVSDAGKLGSTISFCSTVAQKKHSAKLFEHLCPLHQIAYLAKSCTHEEPRMRPTMRSVVVALMALSSKDHELTRGHD